MAHLYALGKMRETGATVDEHAVITIQSLEKAFQDFNQVSQTLSQNYVRLGATVEALTSHLEDGTTADCCESGYLPRNSVNLDQVMHSLPIAIIAVDGNGTVVYANNMASDIFGQSLLGSLWRTTIASGVIRINDNGEMILPDGKMVMATTSPIGYAPGQLILFQDVTHTSNLRSMVDKYNRHSLAYQINATMAHQIRTPLTSALLYLAQLKNEVSTEKGRDYIDRIHASLDHLDTIASHVLGIGDEKQTTAEKVAVEDIVREITDMLNPLMISSGCQLTTNIDCEGITIGFDHEMLKSIIMNLIMNSVHACMERDKETIETAKSLYVNLTVEKVSTGIGKCAVRINVEDNGIGIDKERLEDVFNPFYTTKSYGTGLGLPVAKSIIESMCGSIDITSEKLVGTCVTLVIPIDDDRVVES